MSTGSFILCIIVCSSRHLCLFETQRTRKPIRVHRFPVDRIRPRNVVRWKTSRKHGPPSTVLTTRMFFFFLPGHPVEMCLLTNNIHDYYFVSQGKTTIPGLDDGEELLVTDVSATTGQDQPALMIASR